LPERVRQAAGAVKLEPMNAEVPALLERVLFVTDPSRLEYCSISRPEAAFVDRFWQLLIVLPETSNINELMPVGAKLSIPVPWHLLISLFKMFKVSVEKSWFMAIPFDVFATSVMVLLLIVMFPDELDPELIRAIPLSLIPVIVLFVASRVKVLTGVARTSAEPPLLDMVFADAVTPRVVNTPEVCM
jgi:hypothetical protein